MHFCRQSSAFGLVRNEHSAAEESDLHDGEELPAGLPPGGPRGSQRGIHADVAEFLQGMGKGIVRGAVHLHTFLYFRFRFFCASVIAEKLHSPCFVSIAAAMPVTFRLCLILYFSFMGLDVENYISSLIIYVQFYLDIYYVDIYFV